MDPHRMRRRLAADVELCRGSPLLLGATVQPDGVNFAIASRYATSVTLFGIFLTPVFYAVVWRFSGRGPATPRSVPAHESPDGAHTVPAERAGSPGRGEAARPGEAAQTPVAGGRGDHRGAEAVPGDPRLD